MPAVTPGLMGRPTPSGQVSLPASLCKQSAGLSPPQVQHSWWLGGSGRAAASCCYYERLLPQADSKADMDCLAARHRAAMLCA